MKTFTAQRSTIGIFPASEKEHRRPQRELCNELYLRSRARAWSGCPILMIVSTSSATEQIRQFYSGVYNMRAARIFLMCGNWCLET